MLHDTIASSLRRAGSGLAPMLLACFVVGAAAFLVNGGLAASLCPVVGNQAYTCGYPQHVYDLELVGFSTSGPPCDLGNPSAAHKLFISSSDTDPHVNQGAITDDSLYLWSWSYAGAPPAYGWSGILHFSGDIQVQDFQGGGRFLPPDAVFWSACGTGDTLVGRLILQGPVALESPTWGRMKELYR